MMTEDTMDVKLTLNTLKLDLYRSKVVLSCNNAPPKKNLCLLT